MYNLEVEEAHTFFIGTQGWLVHNGGNNGIKFSPVGHPDVIKKGVHIAVNGVELVVRPGQNGTIVFKGFFSKDSDAAVAKAIKIAEAELANNPDFGKALYKAAVDATEYLKNIDQMQSTARAKSAETNFLAKALKKQGFGCE